MDKKIIELIKVQDEGYKCIICCENMATTKVKICRLVDDGSLTSFHVCNECLAKMQKDIENRK